MASIWLKKLLYSFVSASDGLADTGHGVTHYLLKQETSSMKLMAEFNGSCRLAAGASGGIVPTYAAIESFLLRIKPFY